MTLSYDRRAPKPLLDVLAKDGWAHSLVEYGRAGQYALDLQLRGYASGNHWATLYVGLTKAVDLHFLASRGFRLNAHGTYKTPARGWSPEWEKWHSGDKLASFWPQVEDYLERVIPSVGARYLKEGAVQSAISGFASQDLVVIDREAAITFSNQREKMAVTQRLLRPLLAAMVGTSDAAWWKSTPTSLGGECDALAVTPDGKLLAIEVKPGNATGGITWGPLQVRHYANLFTEWASQAPAAAEIIQGMIDQRFRLGLIEHSKPVLQLPIRVEPVLVIGRLHGKAAIARLKEIQARLLEAGFNDPPLSVRSVTLAGRLDPLDL